MITQRKLAILSMTRQVYGTRTFARVCLNEARNKLIGPPPGRNPQGLPDQRDLVESAIGGGADCWILWFDGGRFDYSQPLFREYFEGDMQRCWNGGIGYTGDWVMRNLRGDYPGMGLFSMAALRQADAVDYDGRDHFDVAPRRDIDEFAPTDKLAALGYMEESPDPSENLDWINPRETNSMVEEYRDRRDLRGGVVRYLQPHPPYNGIEEMTRGSSKTHDTLAALSSGELTMDGLEEAYADTYREAVAYAAELAKDLDGRIILTADHGECHRCGQLFHSRRHMKHGHLCNVPWFEVEAVK